MPAAEACWLFCAISAPSAARVTLQYQAANVGSYYKGTFKVSHGCGASPIKQIVVTILSGLKAAKPMPKADWTLEVTRSKLAAPHDDHDKAATKRRHPYQLDG